MVPSSGPRGGNIKSSRVSLTAFFIGILKPVVNVANKEEVDMTKLWLSSKGASYSWVKIIIAAWMFTVIFVYLLLFGPPEFWSICERIGVMYTLQQWQAWLQPYFTAGYLS